VIGDLIRAYEAGRLARRRREPFDWQPAHFRPAVREFWRLGWKDAEHAAVAGNPQLSLLPATLPLQSSRDADNVAGVGNDLEAARESQ